MFKMKRHDLDMHFV